MTRRQHSRAAGKQLEGMVRADLGSVLFALSDRLRLLPGCLRSGFQQLFHGGLVRGSFFGFRNGYLDHAAGSAMSARVGFLEADPWGSGGDR